MTLEWTKSEYGLIDFGLEMVCPLVAFPSLSGWINNFYLLKPEAFEFAKNF